MSVSAWIVFTRPAKTGPVSKPESCFGVAHIDIKDESFTRKRKFRDVFQSHGGNTIENVQLVGLQPPFIVPYIKWKVNIRYSSRCEYNVPLEEHLKGRDYPKVKIVELDDDCIFSEYENVCKNDKESRIYLNNCVIKSGVVPLYFKIQNMKSFDDIKFDIRNSDVGAWIQQSYFIMNEGLSIDDIISMHTLHNPYFLYECMYGNYKECKNSLKLIKEDIKNLFKVNGSGNLRIYDMEHEHLSKASLAFSRVWARNDFQWIDIFVVIKIFKGLHSYLKMQKNSCRGYFAGADLESICNLAKIESRKMTSRQRSMISEIMFVENADKIFTREMYETVTLTNDMLKDCHDVYCIVHRGVSRYCTKFGTTCISCEYIKNGDVVTEIKKHKFHKNIAFRNIHALTPKNFVRLSTWIRDNFKGGTITFTFDPSGCYCESYYNWCIAIFCKVFYVSPNKISYYEDSDIYKLNGFQIMPCNRINALRRSWKKSNDNKLSELNIFWVKASLDIDDEDDHKEGDEISRNSWVRHIHEGNSSYGIVTSVGKCGINIKKYFRSGDIKTIQSIKQETLRKIHAIPGDILSTINSDFSIDVMGIYAPTGIGPFSGWDIQNLLRCMAKTKKRIYVYDPNFEDFLEIVNREIGQEEGVNSSSYQSRMESFMKSELLSKECIDEFSQIDPCLKTLLEL